MNLWVMLIGGLLGFGILLDFIVKKRKLEVNPEEGAKNTSDSELVYMETYLHNTRDQQNDIGHM